MGEIIAKNGLDADGDEALREDG